MTLTFIKPVDHTGGPVKQSLAFERSLRAEGLWDLISEVIVDNAANDALPDSSPRVVAKLDNGDQQTYRDLNEIRAAASSSQVASTANLEVACW